MIDKKAPQKILDMRQFETRVHDVLNMIKLCKMSHAASLEYIVEKICNESARRHGTRNVYSAYMQGYVQGLVTVHRQDIERNCLEFCYYMDGTFYTTSKEDTGKPKVEVFYGTPRVAELNTAESGTVWKGTKYIYYGFDKGTVIKKLDAYRETL